MKECPQIVVTEQYPEGLGPTVEQSAELAPARRLLPAKYISSSAEEDSDWHGKNQIAETR